MTPVNLATVVLPAIKAARKELPTTTQNQTLKDITTFPRGSTFAGFGSASFSSSTTTQLLKEGEVVGDEEEEEERTDGKKDVITLPAMDGAERTDENAEMAAQYDDDNVDIDDDD